MRGVVGVCIGALAALGASQAGAAVRFVDNFEGIVPIAGAIPNDATFQGFTVDNGADAALAGFELPGHGGITGVFPNKSNQLPLMPGSPTQEVLDPGTVDPSALGLVPEPAGWALMVLGFGGAGAMLRRRRAGIPA
jgi:hypothetical protein